MPERERNNLKNYSPLRYPGGKKKLYPLVASIIDRIDNKPKVYVEPFAGGAGIALSLLFHHNVEEIVINDYDKAVYSMWRAILTQTTAFLKLLNDTEITIDEWHRQKGIYLTQNKKYSLELGFATFFLNRVNRSGILSAGPIGGFLQKGDFKIDVRFNKKDLEQRIRKIAAYKKHIHLYNFDVRTFLAYILPKYEERAFVYFDPPYFNKGKQLYKNFLLEKDHQEIYNSIQLLHCPWMVTYDDAEQIKRIYHAHSCWYYDLVYGVANSGRNSEIMYISDETYLPESSDEPLKTFRFRKEKTNM